MGWAPAGSALSQYISVIPLRLRKEVRAPLVLQSHCQSTPLSQGFIPGFSYFMYMLEQKNNQQDKDKTECAGGC